MAESASQLHAVETLAEQRQSFVGPNGAWAMATPVEQAIEGDIVWVSPLMNLRNAERDELLGISAHDQTGAARRKDVLTRST